MKSSTVKLRVSEADKARFEAVAALDGRTLSEEIRWLVVQRLAELEEQAAARAAARRRRGYHDPDLLGGAIDGPD